MATFRDKLPEKEAALVAKLKAETEEVLFYRVMKPTMVEDVKAFPYQLVRRLCSFCNEVILALKPVRN